MYERTYHSRVLKTDDETAPKRKSKKKYKKKLFFVLGILIVLLTSFVFLARMQKMQIAQVEIEGENVADPLDVSVFVMKELEGNILWVLPRKSVLMAPTRRLEKSIVRTFPRFETVDVDRTNFATLRVSVVEYGGVYLWCITDTSCKFMDKNGIVFADAPYFSGSAYPKIFVGTEGELPFTPITKEQLGYVETLLDRLYAIGIEPSEFRFVTDHELSVIFPHHSSVATLKFDPTLNVERSLEALFTGIRTQPLAGKFGNSELFLDYIDLRFAHKVVYKFK